MAEQHRPHTGPSGPSGPSRAFVGALRAAVRGESDFGPAARALTTMDASNYRRVPLGVLAPRDADDIAAALTVCQEYRVPVVARGGGTSIAGQATGTGLVLDLTRHLRTVLDLDPVARTAVVQPGVVLDDLRAAELAGSVRTLAQYLEEYAPDWTPPRLDRPVTGQTHCHQHAVLGDAAERRLRERMGLTGELSGGCCGLAGNFGFEKGHWEVSVACAEEQLLPSVRESGPESELLADGFSCRTQLDQLAGRRARHLAEVIADGLEGGGR